MKDSAKYKNAIAKACLSIANSRAELFTDMVNVAMTGSYKEIDLVFEVGEIFHFETEHFRNCDDINLQKLYLMVTQLEECHASLVNLNGLKDEYDDEIKGTV